GSAAAPAVEAGGMTSGVGTSRLHAESAPATASAPAASVSRRAPVDEYVRIICMSRASEGQVEARDEVPHLGLREEVPRAQVVLAEDVDLGVEPRVLRPRAKVPAREGQRQR